MQRLSPLDSAFLRAETPGGHMHVGWVSVLGPVQEGGALDVDLLRQRVAGRLHLEPRFRQVVVSTPVGEPYWVDDPRFDIDRHLRVVGQHGTLGKEEVREIADRFLSAPLDRGKPLWELLVLPRVEGGRAAIVGKVHHAMVDGIAAVELGMLLFDLAPQAAPIEPARWQPQHMASGLRLTASSATDTAVEQFRNAGRMAALGLSPRRAVRVAETMRRAALSLAEDAMRPAPASYLNRGIDGRRTLATGSLPLERLQRIKRRSDSKLNDVVLTVATGALRRLAALREEEPLPLRAMVPVSVRGKGDAKAGGNRITFAFVDLPVDEPEAARRFALLRAQMADLKQSGKVAGSDLLLRSVVGQLPGVLKDRASRLATSPRLFNLTISNVPGPTRALYAAGVRVESIHPVIPLSDGHALAIGVLSYGGSLQIAAHAHPGVLPEAAELPALIRSSTGELESALGHARRRRGGTTVRGARGARRPAAPV
jgi:diacylglycerol O-acyltransferase / wax synthase